jgi:predicted secreted protein
MTSDILHVSSDHATLVRLNVTASRHLAPDTFSISLQVTQCKHSPASAQEAVNRTIRTAVDTAKAVAGVTVTTGSPYAYEDRKASAMFTATQALTLTGSNCAVLLDLAGQLQRAEPTLALRGTHFSLSDLARNAQNAELLKEALVKADAIAATIKDATGATGMTAVELSPDLNGDDRFGGVQAMAASRENASAPVAEPEDLEVSLTLNAVYKLTYTAPANGRSLPGQRLNYAEELAFAKDLASRKVVAA